MQLCIIIIGDDLDKAHRTIFSCLINQNPSISHHMVMNKKKELKGENSNIWDLTSCLEVASMKVIVIDRIQSLGSINSACIKFTFITIKKEICKLIKKLFWCILWWNFYVPLAEHDHTKRQLIFFDDTHSSILKGLRW